MRVGATRPIPVDVRIISATHCDLEALVREGRFRADLFYRLSVLRLRLPPLRERPEDLAPLAEWLLKNALAALGVRPHANLHAEIIRCAKAEFNAAQMRTVLHSCFAKCAEGTRTRRATG